MQGHWPLPPELPGGEGEDPGDPDGEDPGDPEGEDPGDPPGDDDEDPDVYVLVVCVTNEIKSGPCTCQKHPQLHDVHRAETHRRGHHVAYHVLIQSWE